MRIKTISIKAMLRCKKAFRLIEIDVFAAAHSLGKKDYWPTSVWPEKNRQMSLKVAQKWFHYKKDRLWHLCKNCFWMLEIWANLLLPKALKSCPKPNKLPNLVTLTNLNYQPGCSGDMDHVRTKHTSENSRSRRVAFFAYKIAWTGGQVKMSFMSEPHCPSPIVWANAL